VSSLLPAIVSGIAFAIALRTLPLLHPVQLWSGSWAVATILYELRLLPYRDLGWLTAGIICGTVVMFAVGVRVGERLLTRRPAPIDTREEAHVIRLAALVSIPLLTLTFLAFIVQLMRRFGVSHVLRVSSEVKLYLSSGEAPLAGTYVDFALAATVLCAFASVHSRSRRERRGWQLTAVACSITIYFSTSRAYIAVALVAGLAVLAVAGPMIDRKRLAAAALAAVAVISVSFLVLGSLLGKTYGNSGIGEFDNFFSRHPTASWLALPYEDVTASIPALDLQVRAATTWGRAYGCATAPIACGIVRRLGVPVVRVPVTGPFTRVPLQWNAYTALDRFLIDGGTALVLVFVLITGILAGSVWALARRGSVAGILVYSLAVPALIAADRNNLLELVGISAVLAFGTVLFARTISRSGGRPARVFERVAGAGPGAPAPSQGG
jgi:oligosaccharide repeat unit polymerase